MRVSGGKFRCAVGMPHTKVLPHHLKNSCLFIDDSPNCGYTTHQSIISQALCTKEVSKARTVICNGGDRVEIKTHSDLLLALLKATKPSQVQAILKAIGDRPELSVDQTFGDQGYCWHFYGDNESNMSSVNLGTKPGRSLTERVTNALDAVLEKEMTRRGGTPPASIMEAAKRWFGRPPSTVDSGLFSWKDFKTQDYDKLVRLVMTLGDEPAFPTVDVIDNGIGIKPDNFAHSILSLQKGNKIKKRYLAGAWGQGGAATLSFSRYVMILSRYMNSPQVIGFTLIKKMRLEEPYKEDAYVYLAMRSPDGVITVPSFEQNGPLELYPSIQSDSKKPGSFDSGTLVRHYGYQLDGLDKTLSSDTGNLYHLFQYMMFDPLLPFRIVDLRKEGAFKNELITGSRNRLMKIATKQAESTDEEESEAEESGTELRRHFQREMISPRGDVEPSIGVEYWVILNRKKGSGDKVTLRPSSSQVYVERNHPIIATFNGQDQGEMTAQLLRELRLSMVAKHIVIHLDATQADKDIRNNLFTSTRESLREGEVRTELMRVLSNILRDDGVLHDIERELEENLLQRETTESNQEVRKQITSLLRDAGFQVKEPGEVLVAGSHGPTTVSPPRVGHRPGRAEPLDTLPYPEVTRFEIVFPKEKLEVHQDDNQVIKVETDANFRFGRERKLAIRFEPPHLEVASEGILSDGRMNWRVRPKENAAPGSIGQVIATLTKPDGSQMIATLPYEILPAREEPTKKAKGMVPAFTVLPIDPYTERDQFEQLWPDLDLNSEEDVKKVAYKAVQLAEGITVRYSTAFGPYREQAISLAQQPTLLELFKQTYQIWIGYHAIIQSQQKQSDVTEQIDEEQIEKIQEQERALVATVQVKQAMELAKLRSQLIKHESSE